MGGGGIIKKTVKATPNNTKGTVYTYELGGKAPAPAVAASPKAVPISGVKYDKSLVADGLNLYVSSCVACHGVPGMGTGGALPNLAYVPAPMIDNLKNFVINGPATERGMPNFAGKLSDDEIQKIRAFVLDAAAGVKASKK